MPTRSSDAIPSFIHVEQLQQNDSALHRPTSLRRHQNTTGVGKSNNKNFSHSSILPKDTSVEQTTLFLKRFSISRDSRHHPFSASKRRGRPATSRMRGKHGLVKSINSYSGHCRHHFNDGNSSSSVLESGPFNKDTRLAHLKKYMQSRRLRLRQRLSQRQQQRQTNPLDTSDMSLDEADIMDEDDNDLDDNSGDDGNVLFTLDQNQRNQYMWNLKERLWERTRSAAKSRSHFLMERQLSAGGRVDHVQRVVQRQRTEQEKRQHRARDVLEQKMMRAMARRNAYLEAAIENDPSRRFRRKSNATAMASNPELVKRKSHTTSATVTVVASTSKGSSMRQSPAVITTRGHEKAKNSAINMTQATKKHLTNMTSTIAPKTVRLNASASAADIRTDDTVFKEDSNNNSISNHDPAKLDKVTLLAQRKTRERMVQQASREYMQAIGGSHERVLSLSFDELAKLLHSNKPLIQATVRLLKYSSQLIQMDAPVDQPWLKRVFNNPARVFLSMYMVLAHPGQIRSPEEPATAPSNDDASGQQTNDETFDSLVESSKALLEALQTWMSATIKNDLGIEHDTNTDADQDLSKDQPLTESPPVVIETPVSTDEESLNPKDSYDPMLLRGFDQAWTSYYHLFQAWKDKDARRLLQTLLEHARQIESLWCTVQNDPSARAEWEPRIEEQRTDLRAKAEQLAGTEGTDRLDAIFADFVNTTTAANDPTPATGPISQQSTGDSSAAGASTATMDTTATPTATTTEPATAIEPATTPVVKKRQRASSSSKHTSEANSTSSSGMTKLKDTMADEVISDSAKEAISPVDQEQPKAKKPAKSKAATPTDAAATNPAISTSSSAATSAAATVIPEDVLGIIPSEYVRPAKWSNLQMIHELALDSSFKLEHKRPLVADAGPTELAPGSVVNMQNLEAQVRAMATKAYFDKIREDAEEGNLGKWIPSLLTSMREQILDMVPPNSAFAMQVMEGFDIEFVQQQVDKKVYDIKAALSGVLDIMSKLCAPARDPAIKKIQADLKQTPQGSLGRDLNEQEDTESTSTTDTEENVGYSATSATPKDLVSVLQDILEMLEIMLMDLANFRLTVARPKLEKEAIPYEQNAFKKALDKNELTLDATKAWLQESAKKVIQSSAAVASSVTTTDEGERGTNSGVHRHIYYEILVHAILDLVFSSKHFDVSPDREQFPATLALDRERMSRYQNEAQGLALAAVILNISLNIAPVLKEDEQGELKLTLLKLLESPQTSLETLADAVIESKEKALLSAARQSELSSSTVPSSHASTPGTSPSSSSSPSMQTTSTKGLLLSEEQKSYIRNTISRAITFDSTLFKVLSDRIRKTLESVLLSAVSSSATQNPSGIARVGVMPDRASLKKMGLGALGSEIETLAGQIRFLTKYNAQVYRQWYDNILGGVVKELTSPSSSSSSK
ncbi:hypothetical protein BGX27_005987 [Mortierella sp. AM989]|nr:hypothetical protein BGX27_005987 [Mortierella sp. AM989]